MKRIAIMGCSGSGKSTLARALGVELGLPVHHLDAYYWQPGWGERDAASFNVQLDQIAQGDAWIIDGGYNGLDQQGIRFKRADVFILFERSVWLCLFRVLRRLVQYRNRTRPDMGEACPEKVDLEFLWFIWNHRKTHWPRVLDRVAKHDAPVILLRQDPVIPDLILELKTLSVSAQTSSANLLAAGDRTEDRRP